MVDTVKKLEQVLANSYVLYLKTQNYHWNVEGPFFASLHALFQTQYEDLAMAIDEIAEHIRSLGAKAPGTMAEFLKRATLDEAQAGISATEMIEDLEAGQVVLLETLQEALDIATESGDEVVAEFLTGRMAVHRKNKWMLKSSL